MHLLLCVRVRIGNMLEVELELELQPESTNSTREYCTVQCDECEYKSEHPHLGHDDTSLTSMPALSGFMRTSSLAAAAQSRSVNTFMVYLSAVLDACCAVLKECESLHL